MRNFFKFILIAGGAVAALFILLLAAAAIIIPAKYPPAKLKAMATDQLSKTLNRKVSIGNVHFNIFSGFEITQLAVSNRPGWAPGDFLKAGEISISYHLFPLLWGQVSLGQVELKDFQVLVERRGLNDFNFSDMAGSSAPTTQPKTPSKKKAKARRRAELPTEGTQTASTGFFFASPVWAGETTTAAAKPSKTALLISVDSVRIQQGKMTYVDETVSPAQRSELKDLDLTVKDISMVGGKTSFELDAPISYNKMNYHLTVGGVLRYFLSGQSIKDLQVKGSVNDLAFGVSGSVQDMTGNYAPDLDGTASLDMLKFAGLVPDSLSQMPPGLSLTGPAQVAFHLGGNARDGLALSGTADGSKLAIAYKDLFVKTASTTCKVTFKTLNQLKRGIYDVPSFKVTYADWEVNGAFHYHAGTSYSGEIHSKRLPFGGLSNMIPKLKKAAFDGTGSVDMTFSQALNKPNSFNVRGQVLLKGVGVSFPQEPYLQDLTGPINFTGDAVRLPKMTFKSFDGTGAAGVTYGINNQAYSYAFRLTGVNAQKAVDASIDAYVTTKDFSAYKDKLFGTMNLAYAGLGRGLSGDAMIDSALGTGNYSLVDAKIANLAAITAVNKYFKDPSNQITFQKIAGTLNMKNKVFSYTADTIGKVGAIHETGGIDVSQMVYTPDMMVRADIKKDFINSDAVAGALPSALRGLAKNVDVLTDAQGNIPVDFKFTGPVKNNQYAYDWTRITQNVEKHAGQALQKAAQGQLNNIGKNLGNQIKSLFGR